jgi:hypothetical protein
MSRIPVLMTVIPLLCLCLSGCYSDQKKQLAACQGMITHKGEGEPLRTVQTCMDKAGYDFVGYANPDGLTVICDLPALIRGEPSADGSDAKCFQPKSRIGLFIYHMEMPVRNPT